MRIQGFDFFKHDLCLFKDFFHRAYLISLKQNVSEKLKYIETMLLDLALGKLLIGRVPFIFFGADWLYPQVWR